MQTTVNILVVDDDITNRLVLRALLKESGFTSVECDTGNKAVVLAREQSFDIVLMDVMMPGMDGYEAARIIKQESAGFIPIIFLTAMTDEKALIKCIEAGGDDFLTKPYNHVLLRAKIDSMLRISKLYKRIEDQNAELNKHNARIQQEMNVAKRVLENVLNKDKLSSACGLRSSMSPMSIFNGDLILSEFNNTGGLDVIISDFTGHGLSAAIGSIPVADIFHTMTRKGFSFTETLAEANNKLVKLLPTQMFMAAALISVDRNNNVVSIVNAGLPELYLYRKGKIVRTFKSQNLPLGIINQAHDDLNIEMEAIEYGDRIIAATDGIMEAMNAHGEFYGKQRIIDSIEQARKPEYVFDKILSDCREFVEGSDQRDDITLLELCHLEQVKTIEAEKGFVRELQPVEWSMQFNIDAKCLRNFDILPYIMQGINGLQSIPNGRSTIHTILTEIYTNALDHGLLKLDSSMKSSPDGYMAYYQEKTNRLENIEKGYIQIILNHELNESGGGRLTIHVIDSGDGFDYKHSDKSLADNQGYSGRGLALIKHLCKDVTYLGKGNAIMAIYEWH